MRRLLIAILVAALALPCWGEMITASPRYSSAAHTIYYGTSTATKNDASIQKAPANYTLMHMAPLNLPAGMYTLSEWRGYIGGTRKTGDTLDIAGAYLVIFSSSGGTYTLVWSCNVLAAITDSASSRIEIIDSTELATAGATTITLQASTAYYAGIWFKKAAAVASVQTPYLYCMDGGAGPLDSLWWKDSDLGTGSAPATTAVAPDATTSPAFLQQWTLTTTNYKLYESAETVFSGTELDVWVPQSASDYWIFLRGVVVDDGEMLTVALNNQANAAEVATQTLTIDMGATDQVGFGGANVALNQRWTGTCTGGVYEADEEGKTTLTLNTALDRSWWIAGDGKRARYLQITGVGTFLVSTYVDTTHIRVTGNASAASDSAYSLSEEGDTFDVGINVRPVANKVDVFWTNLTTGQGSQSSEPYKLRDIITRGHACSAGTPTRHATAYACTLDPAWITISGADTAINKIEVAYRPLLILGDSQTITLPSALEAPEAYRLGSAMLTAMSNDRVGWLLGASGAYLSSDGSGVCEALYKKYVNATPGLGDGCEMSGVVLLFAAGVNEISTIIGGATPTTEQRNKAVGVLSEGAGRILSELYSQALDGGAGDGRHAIICGLPRFPGSATPTEEQIAQDTAVKCWNYALEGLAAGCSATFYNPYSLGTSIISTSDYVHYTTEGATTVAGKIANIYEQGAWRRTAGGQKWIEW